MNRGRGRGAAGPWEVWHAAEPGSDTERRGFPPAPLPARVCAPLRGSLYRPPRLSPSWDRNQKRRRHSGQQSGGRQQESQQPLTDLSPTAVSILGPYSDSVASVPEAEEPRQGRERVEKLGGHGKSAAFQLNR